MLSFQNPDINIQTAGWSVGTYCNADCAHCYSVQVRNNSNTSAFLSKHEIDLIIDNLVRSNVKIVNLGGNEPIYTNGPDASASLLPYIIRQAVSAGIQIGITTNGVTPYYLQRYALDCLHLVNDWDVSLDSPFEHEHNQNRGKNLFQLALKTLAYFHEAKMQYSIVTCAMNWNTTREHARGLVDLASKYNAEIRINSIRPIVHHQFSLQPTRKQFYEFFCELDSLTTSIYIGEPILACLANESRADSHCGKNSICVHTKTELGQIPITPCVFLKDYECVDLLGKDVSELVNSISFQKFKDRTANLPKSCVELNCEWLEKCRGGCTSRAWLNNKDLNSPDPLCPKLAQNEGIKLPTFLSKESRKNGIRVHEGYLCTWIGKPRTSNSAITIAGN
jgi:radical SAM protein with 4Fe4S-binding SPASM domain